MKSARNFPTVRLNGSQSERGLARKSSRKCNEFYDIKPIEQIISGKKPSKQKIPKKTPVKKINITQL